LGEPRKDRTLLGLAAGSLVFLAVLAAVVFAQKRLRSAPREGLVLTLAPGDAPRHLRLTYSNAGSEPRSVVLFSEDAGAEVIVRVRDERGELVPEVPALPGDVTAVSTAVRAMLAPGEARSVALDLDRFVRLPGPGQYTVTVDRAALWPNEPRLRSNELSLSLR